MYIQITTKCNMSCPHCCFSCEQGKPGEFMSKETFLAALAHCESYGGTVCIGGGEPTLHPKFMEFLLEAIAVQGLEIAPWLATNGSVKKTSLLLAKLARSGAIGCALSQDAYHAPIDEEVISAFTEGLVKSPNEVVDNNDLREIRDVTYTVLHAGSAIKNQLASRYSGCICGDTFIKPDGSVMACGCEDAYLVGDLSVLQDDGKMSRLNEVVQDSGCGSLSKLTCEQVDYIEGTVSELAA